jgi:hypothetical protein
MDFDCSTTKNENFDKLLHDVIENPELLLDTSLVTNETIIELQKKLNPYMSLSGAYDPDNKQVAVCSYTNLREDYLKRFTMTSLVSFLFQVLHEYEVPKENRLWKPVNKESNEMFTTKALKSQLLNIIKVIDTIEETENEVETDKEKLTEKELYEHEEKKVGLLYTVTHMIRDIGLVADTKLHITTKTAYTFPAIKEIINSKQHNISEFSERELPNDNAKNIIYHFLKNWFSFDPSIHIRSGMDNIKTELAKVNNQDVDIDPHDPGHLTFKTLCKNIEPTDEDRPYVKLLTKNKETCNSVLHILRDDSLHESIIRMLNNVEKFTYYLKPLQYLSMDEELIPPQDTFHRWSYFTEVNYEELRTITETLYPERPDLDWAIAIWTTFKGNDKELDEQFKNYCQKHQDEIPSTLKSLEVGKWTLIADFKENRKNIQFYNKNTEVLKRIIDRHTEDKKIGTELMRNRVRQTKAKNIADYGPDAPGLKTYKTTMSKDGKDLVSKGVENVISPEEMKRLEKTRGNIKAAKELEVLEEYEKIIQGLDDIKKFRELSLEEIDKYNNAKNVIKQAKEMLNVPDNAIQIDVFTSNPTTGDFVKTHFYTKCEESLEEESKMQSNSSK